MRARLIFFIWLSTLHPAVASAQEAIFLVRHAEKVDDSRDAVLSPAGQERARALARILRDTGVTVIYTSDFLRTRQTAAPLADALRIEPRIVVAAEPATLVAKLRAEHARDRVLLVGHSNTLPQLLVALGHPSPITIADEEYTNLFVVVPRAGGPPTVVRLRY